MATFTDMTSAGWVDKSGGAGSVSFAGGNIQLTATTTDRGAVGSKTHFPADSLVEVLLSVQVNTALSDNVWIGLRSLGGLTGNSGLDIGYKPVGNSIAAERKTYNGTWDALATANTVGINDTSKHWLRIQYNGSTGLIRIREWTDGESEPSTWLISLSGTSYDEITGMVELFFELDPRAGGSTTATIDDLEVSYTPIDLGAMDVIQTFGEVVKADAGYTSISYSPSTQAAAGSVADILPVTAGNLLICNLVVETDVTGGTFGSATGWTQLHAVYGDQVAHGVWARIATGNASDNFSTSWGVSAYNYDIMFAEISGFTGDLTVDVTAANNPGATSTTSATVSPGNATGDGLALLFAGSDDIDPAEVVSSVTGSYKTVYDHHSWGHSDYYPVGSMWAKGITSGQSANSTVTYTNSERRSLVSVVLEQGAVGTTHDGTATVAGTGAVSAAGEVVASGSATVAGTGTVSAAGSKVLSGSATVAAAGAVSAAGTVTRQSSATVAGVGAVSADGTTETPPVDGSATVAGTGAVSAAAEVVRNVSATVTGTGAVSAVASLARSASATVAGVGAVSADGDVTTPTVEGTATVGATGAVSAAAAVVRQSAVTIAGVGGLAGDAAQVFTTAATVSGVGTIIATGTLSDRYFLDGERVTPRLGSQEVTLRLG